MKTSSADVRRYLRDLAGWVWNRQMDGFEHGLFLQEETLTEMVLLKMSKDHRKSGLSVKMFSHGEETKNGADWEWIIKREGCEIGFRVQAKKLYHESKGTDYHSLDPAKGQIDKLIADAGTGFNPIYVFYNHDAAIGSANILTSTEPEFSRKSVWGCAIASAHMVKGRRSNKVVDLIGVMDPWHSVITPSHACDLRFFRRANPVVFPKKGKPDAPVLEILEPTPWWEVVERIGEAQFMRGYTERKNLAGVAVIEVSERPVEPQKAEPHRSTPSARGQED